MSNWVNPVAFSIGGFEVAWYGILMFVGFVAAISFSIVKMKWWYKIPIEPFYYFLFIGIPVSILGARTWSFIIGDAKASSFGDFFVKFWDFKSGGMAIHGGIFATVIAALIFFPLILKRPKYNAKTFDGKEFHVRQISTLNYFDVVVPCICVGQIIGRWGNFFNHEVFGEIIENPEQSMHWLKVFMPVVYDNMFISSPGGINAHFDPNSFRTPLFLYESFGSTILFIFLYFGCEFIKGLKSGDLTYGYILGYGIIRTIMEPMRNSSFNFSTSLVTSISMIVLGVLLIIYNHLIACRKRYFKFVYFIWISVRYWLILFWSLFSKKIRNKLKNDENYKKNYANDKQVKFIRTLDQRLFYRR